MSTLNNLRDPTEWKTLNTAHEAKPTKPTELDTAKLQLHLGVKPRPLSQCQRPYMDANTNSGVQRYGRQSLWPACAAELQASETRQANHWGMFPNGSEGCPITLVDPAIYCDKKEAGAKEKASPSSPCCGAHPRTRRKVILEAILQLLGTAQGGLHRALDPLEEFVKGM
ncbi:hypothetical protein Taro_030047 [Colocasia esculenta]|uniref:Uncharacterized protein n=1 Tax=Colocasia esculenta TaxID=4460 RepID=A0A843VWR5_COLES|nr:hypothetical protein [Colocasia esculenta]